MVRIIYREYIPVITALYYGIHIEYNILYMVYRYTILLN